METRILLILLWAASVLFLCMSVTLAVMSARQRKWAKRKDSLNGIAAGYITVTAVTITIATVISITIS